MKERATLILEPTQIGNILFEHLFGSYDQKTKEKILETFKIEYKVTNKTGLMCYAKTVKFVLEYYTQIDSLGGTICNEIILSLNDLNNIIDEKISSEGYEIDCLDIKSRSGLNELYICDDSLICLLYHLKKKEKVKTKTKSRGIMWKQEKHLH